MVRCSPGSFTKFLFATAPTTYTSPMCSITGAIATGIIKRKGSHCQWVIVSNEIGFLNQGAVTTSEKSTMPIVIATIYPTTTPHTTGTNFIKPLQNVSTRMAVKSEMSANNQDVFAMFTALPERDRPMRMMTGPITTGGKMWLISFLPCHLTRALMMKYTSGTPVRPARAPGSPHGSVAAMIGAMKANELPKKIGTLPLVTA